MKSSSDISGHCYTNAIFGHCGTNATRSCLVTMNTDVTVAKMYSSNDFGSRCSEEMFINDLGTHCCATMCFNSSLGSHCCDHSSMQVACLLDTTRQTDRQANMMYFCSRFSVKSTKNENTKICNTNCSQHFLSRQHVAMPH